MKLNLAFFIMAILVTSTFAQLAKEETGRQFILPDGMVMKLENGMWISKQQIAKDTYRDNSSAFYYVILQTSTELDKAVSKNDFSLAKQEAQNVIMHPIATTEQISQQYNCTEDNLSLEFENQTKDSICWNNYTQITLGKESKLQKEWVMELITLTEKTKDGYVQLTNNQFNFTYTEQLSGLKKDVDPDVSACGALSSADTTYTLTQDVSVGTETCFTVSASNVTLDCQGFMITGNNVSGSRGVYSNQAYTTVKNCVMNETVIGIQIDSSAQYANLTGNSITISHTTSCSLTTGRCIPIYVNGADDGYISHNFVSAFIYPIALRGFADNHVLEYNRPQTTGGGAFGLDDADNNTIQYNNATSNSNYAIYGDSADNNLIQYNNLSSATNAIFLFTSTGNTIQYNNITASGNFGMAMRASPSNRIQFNNISAAQYGVYMRDATNIENNVTQNYIETSGATATIGTVHLIISSNSNVFENNTINSSSTTANQNRPIYINSGNHNQFINNKIYSHATATTPAIEILASMTNNTFHQNNITAPVWVNDAGTTNHYNTTGMGNRYYFPNGTGAWEVFDITASSGDWADGGTDRPFNATTVGGNFTGAGLPQDWHPYVAPPPVTTCTPPTLINTDWTIDLADNCEILNWEFDMGTGSIYFGGSGTLKFFNPIVNTTKIQRNSSGSGTISFLSTTGAVGFWQRGS